MNFDHLMAKVRSAATCGIGSMSTGEALSVALVLNRTDWLNGLGYSIAEALARIDSDTIALLPIAERAWRKERDALKHIEEIAQTAAAVSDLLGGDNEQTVLDLNSSLVTYSEAAGYRSVRFLFDVEPIGVASKGSRRISLSIRPEDAETIITELLAAHRFAWTRGKGPLDQKAGEKAPRWVSEKL